MDRTKIKYAEAIATIVNGIPKMLPAAVKIINGLPKLGYPLIPCSGRNYIVGMSATERVYWLRVHVNNYTYISGIRYEVSAFVCDRGTTTGVSLKADLDESGGYIAFKGINFIQLENIDIRFGSAICLNDGVNIDHSDELLSNELEISVFGEGTTVEESTGIVKTTPAELISNISTWSVTINVKDFFYTEIPIEDPDNLYSSMSFYLSANDSPSTAFSRRDRKAIAFCSFTDAVIPVVRIRVSSQTKVTYTDSAKTVSEEFATIGDLVLYENISAAELKSNMAGAKIVLERMP